MLIPQLVCDIPHIMEHEMAWSFSKKLNASNKTKFQFRNTISS